MTLPPCALPHRCRRRWRRPSTSCRTRSIRSTRVPYARTPGRSGAFSWRCMPSCPSRSSIDACATRGIRTPRFPDSTAACRTSISRTTRAWRCCVPTHGSHRRVPRSSPSSKRSSDAISQSARRGGCQTRWKWAPTRCPGPLEPPSDVQDGAFFNPGSTSCDPALAVRQAAGREQPVRHDQISGRREGERAGARTPPAACG